MNAKSNFGALVKFFRKQHGLSLGDLAKKAITSKTSIFKIEEAGVSPRFELAKKLINSLSIPLDIVFGATEAILINNAVIAEKKVLDEQTISLITKTREALSFFEFNNKPQTEISIGSSCTKMYLYLISGKVKISSRGHSISLSERNMVIIPQYLDCKLRAEVESSGIIICMNWSVALEEKI